MTAQQLKNAILQEAIQGRLVPQDPNDEPASVLLDRIRKEKQQLVKEGKLKKKDLEEKPISEDEIPFEIPDSWEWVRLGDIGMFERGNGIKRDETLDKGYPCVRYGEMYTRYKYAPTFDKTVSYTSKSVFDKCRKAHKGDLFMALTGENKQDISLASQYIGEEEIAVGGDLCHLTILDAYPLYFVYLINSYYFSTKKEVLATGDIIVHISTDKLGSIPIPLPPLAEQKRIVAKIEELLPKVEKYGKAQEKLNKLNEELPERLKKSILQEAIEGRLVPQDPNDEPASVLLAKIREEKKQLVKAGKLKKKDLEEKPISEDEIPFEIPESWEWVRLKEISSYRRGSFPQPYTDITSYGGPHSMPFVQVADVDEYFYRLKDRTKKTISKKAMPFSVFVPNGTVVVTLQGSIGKVAITQYDSYVDRTLAIFNRIYGQINKMYFSIALKNKFEGESLYARGATIKTITKEEFQNFILPLPPLAEQHRIVEKIEQLFKEIDKLKTK